MDMPPPKASGLVVHERAVADKSSAAQTLQATAVPVGKTTGKNQVADDSEMISIARIDLKNTALLLSVDRDDRIALGIYLTTNCDPLALGQSDHARSRSLRR